MKLQKLMFVFLMAVLLVPSAASAGDFDWIRDFNIMADADPAGFRARLAARFKLGDLQIDTVLSNVERPADAYMVLRLGEMSRRPTDFIIREYRSGKANGWGALAKSLGIKPGSSEFHALKCGSDLNDNDDKAEGKSKGKGKEKKGKGKK